VVIRVVSEVRLGSSKVAQKTRVVKRPTVADLASAKKRPAHPEFTEEQLREVKEALEINEGIANPSERLSYVEVHEHLTKWFGLTVSRTTFERMVRQNLGRKTWARAR
jgi:hypothetical protein